MKALLSRKFTVPASMCDSSGRLGIPDTFAAFMDIAGEHAELLGVGMNEMLKRGIFWLTVRTRVKFYKRPGLLSELTLSSWPEKPGAIRCNRDYALTDGGETLILGRTEWAVLELATGSLIKPAEVFPAGLEYHEEITLPGPFMRLGGDFEGAETVSRHEVRSTDIDLGGHMNNSAYLYALADCFTAKEWQELDIREVEIAFRSPSYEGDTLLWQRMPVEDGYVLRAQNGDKTAALVKLTLGGAPNA